MAALLTGHDCKASRGKNPKGKGHAAASWLQIWLDSRYMQPYILWTGLRSGFLLTWMNVAAPWTTQSPSLLPKQNAEDPQWCMCHLLIPHGYPHGISKCLQFYETILPSEIFQQKHSSLIVHSPSLLLNKFWEEALCLQPAFYLRSCPTHCLGWKYTELRIMFFAPSWPTSQILHPTLLNGMRFTPQVHLALLILPGNSRESSLAWWA